MKKIKGSIEEKKFSKTLHSSFLPVLVSPLLLRSVDAGQIDVAGMRKENQSWVLSLFEVKSSIFPSPHQWQRLLRSQDYLSRILGIDTKLEVKFCQKDEA